MKKNITPNGPPRIKNNSSFGSGVEIIVAPSVFRSQKRKPKNSFNKSITCLICGKKLFGIKNAKKLRKLRRCQEHINEKINNIKPIEYWKSKPGTRKEKYYQYIETDIWKEKANKCKQRYNNKCAICYSDKKIATHHRTYRNLFDEPQDDLICLCDNCHKLFHGKMESVL